MGLNYLHDPCNSSVFPGGWQKSTSDLKQEEDLTYVCWLVNGEGASGEEMQATSRSGGQALAGSQQGEGDLSSTGTSILQPQETEF